MPPSARPDAGYFLQRSAEAKVEDRQRRHAADTPCVHVRKQAIPRLTLLGTGGDNAIDSECGCHRLLGLHASGNSSAEKTDENPRRKGGYRQCEAGLVGGSASRDIPGLSHYQDPLHETPSGCLWSPWRMSGSPHFYFCALCYLHCLPTCRARNCLSERRKPFFIREPAYTPRGRGRWRESPNTCLSNLDLATPGPTMAPFVGIQV